MEEITLTDILTKNPQINQNDLNKMQEMVKQVRATGGKSAFVAAMPPVDPYSTLNKPYTLNPPRLHNRLHK